jgi:signal transduction histidine kinase
MFTKYEKKDGLAGNSVSCILEDEHGALVLASAWGLHGARVYQLAREFQAQLEGRVDERLRVARELHDTLLQSFHGSLFRFQAARNKLPWRAGEAMQALDGAIASAEEAIVEGRTAIQGLRSESSAHSDLERLLSATGQELEGSQHPNDRLASFSLIIEGRRKVLSPIVQDEICRISQKLLRNAFQHAQARRIEAEVRYQATQLRLSIRDERKGIESKVLQEGNRAGHWGLPRVRERAKYIGARLDFWSEEGAGMELTVPSGVAYGSDSGGFRLLRRKAGTDAQ